MASWQSRWLAFLLHTLRLKDSLNQLAKQLTAEHSQGKPGIEKRDWLDAPRPPKQMYRRYQIETSLVDNRTVFTISPRTNPSEYHVLFLHGGAYIKTFLKPHWRFLAKLIDQLNCTVTAPDYPLAPDFTYQQCFDLIVKVYQDLLQRIDPSNLTIMGDSAGGGMSLGLAQRLRQQRIAQPQNIILLSPWLDVTMSNPEIVATDNKDPLLSVAGLKSAGIMYAGAAGPEHHLVSPINGNLSGLGQINLFIGTHDVLSPDCRKFQAQATAAGVAIGYHEYPTMLHDWMFLPLPEARQALQQIVRQIKAQSPIPS